RAPASPPRSSSSGDEERGGEAGCCRPSGQTTRLPVVTTRSPSSGNAVRVTPCSTLPLWRTDESPPRADGASARVPPAKVEPVADQLLIPASRFTCPVSPDGAVLRTPSSAHVTGLSVFARRRKLPPAGLPSSRAPPS